jgi:hypothetical protein
LRIGLFRLSLLAIVIGVVTGFGRGGFPRADRPVPQHRFP